MFKDLYDRISLLFSKNWPTAEGKITGVYPNPGGRGAQGMVVYEFSVGDDGPYTGEAPWFGNVICTGGPVTVRYRTDDPSVNTIDDDGPL